MGFMEEIQKAFNSGDPVPREWFLVKESHLPFRLCFIYVLFTTIIGPWIMKNKKPFKLRFIMVVLDFSISIAYLVSILTIFWNLQYVNISSACKEDRVEIGTPKYTIVSAMWTIYVLKYIEFIDTIFFVLRKKKNQLSFLHIFHHTMAPILCWVMFRTERSGFQCIIAVLNGIIHVVMYVYYGVAAMGPQFKKYLWWKKHLTEAQMVQFVIIILLLTVVAPLLKCSTGVFTVMMEMIMFPLFLYLFYQLYKAQFKTPKESYDKYVIIHGDV